MTADWTNDQALSRYLLGDLSPEEAAELEKAYFADDRLFERLEVADDTLTEAYLAGELDTHTRAKFERRLQASAQLRERLHLTRALERGGRVERRRDSARLLRLPPVARAVPGRRMTFAIAAAAVLALAGIVWLASVDSGLRRTIAAESEKQGALERRLADLERQAAVRLPGPTASASGPAGVPQPPPRELKIASLLLTGGLARGPGQGNRLAVTADVDLVRLDLAIETSSHRTYRALLSKPDGDQIWSREGLKARTQKGLATVALLIPASAVPPGDYVLSLEGQTPSGAWEVVQDFSFRIVRR